MRCLPACAEGTLKGAPELWVLRGEQRARVLSIAQLMASLDWWVCREVLEGATELRLMLCREKRTGTRVGTSVIAACGAPRKSGSTRAPNKQEGVEHRQFTDPPAVENHLNVHPSTVAVDL